MNRLTFLAAAALALVTLPAAPASASPPTVSIVCASSSNGQGQFRDFHCTAAVSPSMGGYTPSWSIQPQGWISSTDPYWPAANGYCYVSGYRTLAKVTLTLSSPTHTFHTPHEFWCYRDPV